jgi:hypothetical protein
VLQQVLTASLPRPLPTASAIKKNQYAVRFAAHMANRIAGDLAAYVPGIEASTKRAARSIRGTKQLDVNYSTPQLGLALGISLKSVHLRDVSSLRFTHNMKRNEEELRIEASGYHKRQPYAVMIGVLFLPFESCDDAKKSRPSSFGSWVRHLRPYAGRVDPANEIDRFEKLYIALYEPDGSELRFFDVDSDPPRAGRPKMDGPLLDTDGRVRRTLTYGEFLEASYHAYLKRNSAEFRWANGEEAPLEVDESDEEGGEVAET